MTPEQTQDIRRIQAQMDSEREALRVERESKRHRQYRTVSDRDKG